jgi:hypothetical protein
MPLDAIIGQTQSAGVEHWNADQVTRTCHEGAQDGRGPGTAGVSPAPS